MSQIIITMMANLLFTKMHYHPPSILSSIILNDYSFICTHIHYFEEILIQIKHKISRAKFVGRIDCASPATGYGSYHTREQKQLIDEALG